VSESTDASVASAGKPHGSRDTRERLREQGAGPPPEDLDEREQRLTGPRKPMGPDDEQDEVPETVPDEG
jgi:hypothetical protein